MLKKPETVRKGGGNKWLVRSEAADNAYSVLVPPGGGTTFCTCPYFRLGPHRECKHIFPIRLAAAAGVSHPKTAAEMPGPEGPRCTHCKGCECREICTRETTGKGGVQQHACDKRGHAFSENPEYGPKWYPPRTIKASPDLSCRGLSVRDVAAYFEAESGQGEHTPSPKTASRWFSEYIERICACVDRIVPNASDIWRHRRAAHSRQGRRKVAVYGHGLRHEGDPELRRRRHQGVGADRAHHQGRQEEGGQAARHSR